MSSSSHDGLLSDGSGSGSGNSEGLGGWQDEEEENGASILGGGRHDATPWSLRSRLSHPPYNGCTFHMLLRLELQLLEII